MSRDDEPSTSETELSERAMAELSEALLSAYAPKELDPAVNERLIREALEDPLAPPTEEELVESERLRRALDGAGDHPDLDLVRALSTAHQSSRSSDADTETLVDRATHQALDQTTKKPSKPSGGVVYLTFGGVLAAAAAVVLVFSGASHEPGAQKSVQVPAAVPSTEPVGFSRSSEELFKAKFGRGNTSARIDRIASARSRDLRANRFRQWGVR